MGSQTPFQKLSVIRGSLREDEFASYQVDDESKAIRDGFRAKGYTAKEIGLDYRVANHWDEQGILPEGSREFEGQWRKFTLIEAVWIHVALRLRKFGVPLPAIAEIKQCVMEWDKGAEGYPFFEFFFLKAITNDSDHYVAYTLDGHAGLASGRELEILKQISEPQDMLLISLKSVAKALGIDVANITPALTVNAAEISMLHHARGSNTKEVRVSKRGGKIDEVENTRTYPNDSLLRLMTGEMRLKGGYGEITRKFAEGEEQSITVKQTERFK
jgi:DNA-binding transcriptional MerR regulator